ncbi:MAG: hypothetical protein Q7T33_09170, partial [Dehalococcoidia bacterium]|nr:hypothetical protein [Dehalococcoidia bacterium]
LETLPPRTVPSVDPPVVTNHGCGHWRKLDEECWTCALMEKYLSLRARLDQQVPAAAATHPPDPTYTLTGRELHQAHRVAEAVEDVLRELRETHEVPAEVWRAAGEMLVLVEDGDGEGGAS